MEPPGKKKSDVKKKKPEEEKVESGGKKSDQKEKAKGNKQLKGKQNASDKEVVKQKGTKVGNDTQSSSTKATGPSMKRPSAAKDRVKNAHLHWRAHVPDSAKPRP